MTVPMSTALISRLVNLSVTHDMNHWMKWALAYHTVQEELVTGCLHHFRGRGQLVTENDLQKPAIFPRTDFLHESQMVLTFVLAINVYEFRPQACTE